MSSGDTLGSLCGWFSEQGAQLDSGRLAAMRATLGPDLRTAEVSRGDTHAALAVSGPGDAACVDGRWLVGIVGAPRLDDAQLASDATHRGLAQTLARAWAARGEALLGTLAGSYALAVVDAGNADGASAPTLSLAIDRLGQRPLALFDGNGDGRIDFASTAAALKAARPGLALDPQAIASYVFHHMLPAPRGVWHGMEKLQAAELRQWSNGSRTARFHWLPAFEETASFEPLKADLFEAMEAAVRDQLGDVESPGAFLSGGLDSSTVAGILRRVRPAGSARSFSVGFQGADAAGYDELEYARITARHFGTEQHEHITTPAQVAELMPRIAAAYDEPFGNSSAVAVHLCAKMAADNGVELLLAGDGGDEIFAGNDRYARQQLLGVYGRLPAPARALVGAVAPHLPGGPSGLGKPLHKVRRYVEQARVPLPDRLQSNNFLAMFPAETVFSEGLLAQVDLAANFAQIREVYRRPEHGSDLNRMLYLDWQQTLADNDLRKVNVMSALAGVKVAYPFLDERVVAVANRVPSNLKLRKGELRHFYRQAMRGFLADETLSKDKHGFGLPFGVWLRTDQELSDLSAASLESLARRELFQPAFLREAQRLHAEGHASFYGELIWILVMLELWLTSQG